MTPKTPIPSRFSSVVQKDVPHGRNGKHKVLVTEILVDLGALKTGLALKIPLELLETSKAKIRSALNRASRDANISIATSSDDSHLYVWKTEGAALSQSD